MYIDRSCDIDRLLDMPVNPSFHKQAQIIMVKRLCAPGEWPYFVDTDHPITPYDIIESNLNFDACGLTVLALTCDQGPSNRGLATKLGISPEQVFVPRTVFSNAKSLRNAMHEFLKELPTDPSHPLFWLWDFVHLFKTLRNHLLDDIVTLPCGCQVSVQDFYDLLDKVKTISSDHSSGFHISEDHLLVENTDRQDVTMAMQLLSERTAAAFKKYFPNDKVSTRNECNF